MRELSPSTCPKCLGSGRDQYGACALCSGDKKVTPFAMSRACKSCDSKDGYIRKVGPNNTARCATRNCWEFVYCPPKSETGEAVRNVRTRPDLKIGQRERILERDGGECFLCHRRDGILHVAHALSVADAVEAGWSEDEYMDDANLYASCEECNLGLRSRSMEARIFLRLIQLRLRRQRD